MKSSLNKTNAILSYCTLIGWIIALTQVSSSSSEEERNFTAFHLRQMLILMLIGAAVSILDTVFFFIPFLGLIVINILSLALFVCWLLCLISAIQGEKRYVPFVGKSGENMLGDMFE